MKQTTKEIIFELLIAALLVAGVSAIFFKFDVFEMWYAFSRAHEAYELDEIFGYVMAVLLAGSFLSLRHIYLLRGLLRQLEAANQEIRRQERIKSRQDKLAALGGLATGMAHEINNALQPAIGLGFFIKDGLLASGNDKHHAFMETILHSVEHAQHVIQNVLIYTQEKNLGTQSYKAGEVISECVHFGLDLMPTTVQFHFSGFGPLSQDNGQDDIICVNKTSLCQIFLNLFKNATKAMNNSGAIVISCRKAVMPDKTESPAVCIEVKDTGPGMDEETQKRIFDPFFTTGDISEGTGLGLSVVQGLVQHQKGAVTVCSSKGHGTSFSLFFPIAKT